MNGLDVLLREQGGVISAAQLMDLGYTKAQLRQGCDGLTRIRRGWYSAGRASRRLRPLSRRAVV